MSTTRKISRKVRVQRTMHRTGNRETSYRKAGRQKVQTVKTAPTVIKKLIPPDHNKLLKVINGKLRLKPWQILRVDLLNVKVSVTKKKESYVYFEEVADIVVQKQIYSGRRKGVAPQNVVINDHQVGVPKIPGHYNVSGLILQSDGKFGQLILSPVATTQWDRVAA